MMDEHPLHHLAKTAYVELVQPRMGCSSTFDELSSEQKAILIDVVGLGFAYGRNSHPDFLGIDPAISGGDRTVEALPKFEGDSLVGFEVLQQWESKS